MNVPRFPPPPNLSSKVIDDDELTSRRTKALPVSRETRSSRRGDAIVRGGVGPARGPGPGPGEGEGACDTRGRGAVDGYRQRGFTSLKKTNGRFYIVDNLIHPHILKSSRRKIKSKRVTKLTVKMTERDSPRDDDPDDDVVCANVVHKTTSTNSPKLNREMNGDIENSNHGQQLGCITSKSTGVQTPPTIPYRLRMLPSLSDVPRYIDSTENPKKSSRYCRHLRFLGRLVLCQFGLVWLLSIWAVAGAAAFYSTEGPREREQVADLYQMQKELAIDLATELRQVKADEPIWGITIDKYVSKHEKFLLAAVSSGYGEGGGGGGQIWTFPGCILFAVSLLTTLGFGAPVPRTTAGRSSAVVFAAIGIPAHFLLILNTGIFLAVRLQSFATRKRGGSDVNKESEDAVVPLWVKLVPFGCIGGYYILGIICFGVARLRPLAASLLFPLDFTAAGGLATTSGPVRIAYAIYLEGAVTIAAVAVAVLQVSATQSLTNIGLRYGLLTNT